MNIHLREIRKLMLFISSMLISCVIFANPEAGEVVGGSATITSPDANTVQINQTSDKAIINWNSFNVAPQERVNFQQPSSSSIIWNRINPANGASSIEGRLSANGQVWLINPAGILFGQGAEINVAGLLASTADISNEDFMSGHYHFKQSPNWNGAIINEGIIKVAEAGLVALIGAGVVNNGHIEANLGNVVLASGSEFTIGFSGNDMISFAVDGEVLKQAIDQHGRQLKNGVEQAGTIIANGGKVYLSAKAAGDVLDRVINMQGVIEARSVSVQNGTIVLMGHSGSVKVSGKMIASGKRPGERGGNVQVLGSQVALTDDAYINVSGDIGGGEILIGGDYQGKNPLILNAKNTFIGPDVNLFADAVTIGSGGKVIVWANDATDFYGNIFARGGAAGGNGGLVETSGKKYLAAMGSVDASAPFGEAGMWLLDPANVTLSTSATSNGGFDGGSPNTYTTTANTAIANVNTIMTALNSGTSVTILTTPGGTQAGNITVNDAITKTSGGAATFTLTAASGGTIGINDPISATVGALNIVLNGASIINIDADITTNDGSFTSTSLNATNLRAALNTGSGTVAMSANQDGAGTQVFNMGTSGSITTTNTTNSAVTITQNTASGGSGNTTLRDITTGAGGGITVNAYAGTITTTASTLLLTTGQISLAANNMTLSTNANSQIGGSALNVGSASRAIITPGTSGTSISIAGGIGTLDLTQAELNKIRATDVRIGDSNTGLMVIAGWTPNATFAPGVLTLFADGIIQTAATNLATSTSDLIIRGGGVVSLSDDNIFSNIAANKSANLLTLKSAASNTLTITDITDDLGTVSGITAPGGVTLRATHTSSSITLNAGITANAAGNDIVLSAPTFTNNAGTTALSSGVGNFLVWSSDPASDNRGGLTYDFKQYNATYGSTTVEGTGNGFLYTIAPTITPSLIGTISKVYDSTVAATLAASNFAESGAIDGDTITLNNPTDGTYDTKNVGINKNISVTSIDVASANDGSATVYGYQMSTDTANSDIGTITKATLTAGLTSDATKVYDATTAASLASSNYTLTGVLGSDVVLLNNPTTGTYLTKNVGENINVAVSGLTLSGADSSNYQLSATTANSDIGTITKATLTAGLTSDATKVYDATTAASLASSNYTLTGVLGSDVVLLNNPTTGTYLTKNVGENINVAVSGLTLIGADSSNYQLSATTANSDIGTI